MHYISIRNGNVRRHAIPKLYQTLTSPCTLYAIIHTYCLAKICTKYHSPWYVTVKRHCKKFKQNAEATQISHISPSARSSGKGTYHECVISLVLPCFCNTMTKAKCGWWELAPSKSIVSNSIDLHFPLLSLLLSNLRSHGTYFVIRFRFLHPQFCMIITDYSDITRTHRPPHMPMSTRWALGSRPSYQ